MISKGGLHKRHKYILNALKKRKEIGDTTGLSYKSWRRAGMNMWADKLSPKMSKNHFRHHSFATTERYMDRYHVIDEVANFEGNIF